ncbi:MAG: hypothetical protein Q8910_01640 [Bacteroidota bacterium]|nr:hypothetical protein [Bacteroidota bacterium]
MGLIGAVGNGLWQVAKAPWDIYQGISQALTGDSLIYDPNNGGIIPGFTTLKASQGSGPVQPQSTTPVQAQADGADYQPNNNYNGSGSNPYGSVSDEKAYYQDQIDALNRLLGLTDTQLNTGLQNLDMQRTRLGDQQTKTMNQYNDQETQNAQDKQKGIEAVDSFANNNFNSLQRLLGTAGAGNSSVARDLVPYLISKSAGTRRTGVVDTAGANARDIANARADAQDQYKFAGEDLNQAEKDFRTGILTKKNDIAGQISGLQTQQAMADGSGYATAKAAAAGTQAGIDGRIAELNALFGQFNPTYRAVNTKTPELSKFTVDNAQINSDQGLPAESRYYMTMLNKKKQNEVAY